MDSDSVCNSLQVIYGSFALVSHAGCRSLFYFFREQQQKKKQTHGVYLMAQRMNVVCTLFKNAVVANFSDVHMCASISSSGKNEFN